MCLSVLLANSILSIIYRHMLASIIVKENLKLRGFTEFTKITLPLYLVAREWDLRVHAQG